MIEQEPAFGLPAIEVVLELDPSLGHILDADGPLREPVRENVRQRLAEIVRLLGVPGTVKLGIEALAATERADPQWLRLRVNGVSCRYPEEVLSLAWSYAEGRVVDAEPEEVRSRLDEAEEVRVSEYFGVACAEIISRQPAVLLGPAQVAAYEARLEERAAGRRQNPGSGQLPRILQRLLELRISIADTEKVAGMLGDGGEAPWEDVAEDLVDALAPEDVELHVPEAYVARLTARNDEESDLLTFALEGMFTELGIAFPPLHPVPTTGLKPNSFRYSINHLPTLPVVGLEADECLVNDTPERLEQMGIEGRKAVNMATQQPATVVEVTNKAELEAAGFTTWDQAGYCVLCLAVELRRNSASFVHRRSVQIQVEQLGQAFPVLVEATLARVSVERITRLLRMLVAEELSVRNLRLILERLLDYRFRTSDLERCLILDDRLSDNLQDRHSDDLLSFVRSGLKRQISNKYARGTSTVVVYLVDPELESSFDKSNTEAASDEERQEKIVTALANEVLHLPPTAQTPSILTAIGARASLRDAIELRFPRVGVIAYQELRPDVNVQPIARISLR